ncbi:exopolyphosphatase [Deinococcus aquiradiocola]|uniref:Exopolyphosphatase n=1 Tax=Deinococcus aquiradiocola TaxID=393059 RepID=A0A917PR35_9DEIO|nr:exopolyphosphatase [Deinococcus aquiradiocola]
MIAETRPGGFRVLDALKDRTRLGECLDADGNVTEEGFERLAHSLERFRALAASQGIQELRAYATSAMRGAPNGEQVAQRLRAEVGVYPVIISGEREGQLTYLGASGSVHFGPDNVLLDLGGGSLELVRGGPGGPGEVLSVPLGSVRLHGQFLGGTPDTRAPRKRDLAALKAHVLACLEPHLDAFRLEPETQVFGSSGTFETLAAVLAARSGPLPEGGLNAVKFTVADLGGLLSDLSQMSAEKRGRVPGLDPKRADIIVAGAAVLHTVLERLGAASVTVSSGALREGMLLEYLQEQEHWTQGLSARQRSVLELAERFGANLAHARQVTLLSQNLYDRLQSLGALDAGGTGADADDTTRSLLSAAATLHEIGLLVGQSSHHKHSAYLIRHAGLLGYDPAQIEVVAQVARYHRRSVPKASHAEFAALGAVTQRRVTQLAAILRVADGLDRAHTQAARIRGLHRDGRGWVLRVSGAHGLELDGVTQKGDLWAQTFGPLRVETT